MPEFNLDQILIRVKLYLNVESDIQLSKKLNKFDQYIFQCRKRNSIDFEVLLKECYNADFNWLITGDDKKPTDMVFLDDKGQRRVTDKNSINNSKYVDEVNYLKWRVEEISKELYQTQMKLKAEQSNKEKK